jgi:uncharacterized protein (DUF2147 family)
MKISFICIFLFLSLTNNYAPTSADIILGRWITAERNLIVEVYKENNTYKSKIVWFDVSDDPSRPMHSRLDYKNPNPNLRNNKLVGLEILNGLKFNPESERWENGTVYDPNTGKFWSAVIFFDNEGKLAVKGYWKFEFFSKTMHFEKNSRSTKKI